VAHLISHVACTLSFDAEESVSSVGVNVYCVSSSSIEVASRLSKLDDPGFLEKYQITYEINCQCW